MIFGIGTDIVGVARMQDNLQRHGQRFAERLLAPAELHDYSDAPNPAHFLAKRFAAKEAAVKAMGTGFRDGITWKQISVGHDALGKPLLLLDGKAAEFVEAHRIGEMHLSLADETDYAVAYVVMVKQ